MKKFAKAFMVMCLLLIAWSNAWGENQVLTIYFMGTGIKEDAYDGNNTTWGSPELLSFFFKYNDLSYEIDNVNYSDGRWYPQAHNGSHTGRHHKYIVNGVGTSWC